MTDKPLHFEVSTGLKRVLGRELITDDKVAIFELVKNSFDAGADEVRLFFDRKRIIVADNGKGMTRGDLQNKWLFVAYSEKRQKNSQDFRDVVASRGHYAGNKGIGRFSTDRLGTLLTLQSRSKDELTKPVNVLRIDWKKFEADDSEHFQNIPVEYAQNSEFILPDELSSFAKKLRHGTIIEITELRTRWDRDELIDLKAALAKLINPFGAEVDQFKIRIDAPLEKDTDRKNAARAKAASSEPIAREIVNGRVGNFIFETLQEKTTFISVTIDGEGIETTLTDRGEVVYRIREPSPYPLLAGANFRCSIYYLNQSAKLTFARRVGLPSIQFGSVFVFRNGFRVFPIGEDGDDWFGIARRKQQGFSRYLGTREVIGRVDVSGDDEMFQEASSRNQGLIETSAVRQLKQCVIEHGIKRLEKYVVPVSWGDRGDANTDDLSRLLTDPGRSRVSAAVANLVDNDEIELLHVSRKLIGLLNERSSEFEGSIVSLRAIASKLRDEKLLEKIDVAEKRFEALKKSEAEARKIAERERTIALKATEQARLAEADAGKARAEADIERKRAHFLSSVVDLDVATILNLHHQITIYSVDVDQQIENLIQNTAGKRSIPRDEVLKAVEQISFLNRKIHAVTKFAPLATFRLESEFIRADLAGFIGDYIENVSRRSQRMSLIVANQHPGFECKFNPIEVSSVLDNLVSNSKKARASQMNFEISAPERNILLLKVSDNGRGLSEGVNPNQIFEMGYTGTNGSGLGLYHVRQVLGEMNGTIEIDQGRTGRGLGFVIRIARGGSKG